jgi:hypothetical protein
VKSNLYYRRERLCCVVVAALATGLCLTTFAEAANADQGDRYAARKSPTLARTAHMPMVRAAHFLRPG